MVIISSLEKVTIVSNEGERKLSAFLLDNGEALSLLKSMVFFDFFWVHFAPYQSDVKVELMHQE